MIKQLKTFTVNMVAGANVATVALLLLSAYADHINPADHPTLSCMGMAFPVFMVANLLFLFFWLTFKWQRAWIPIAGFVLAYVPLTNYMPMNLRASVTADSAHTLKLITYNVCQYGGNYKYEEGFDTVFGYLRRQQADIVCLQEDADTWRRYVMQRYKKLYAHNDTTIFCNTAASMNGVGIHTRFPILRKERITYESEANGSVAYYLLLDNGDTLLVVNNHLEGTHLTKEDRANYKRMLRGDMKRDTASTESKLLIGKLANAAAKRAPQADAVHRYIASHRQYPIIVCGDFNEPPLSYSVRTIGEGLTDCFATSGTGIGLSYNQKGFFVRIDHIFCSSYFEPMKCEVDSKMDASDHNPMVCWLKMSDNR
ncbi:MAG: endonuclease/exonuclease/phosphatase family protein [Prevotella sp.]|nr:endonuclease/exonuclease/phosphatase family protein [Prevotella sp.]